VDEAAEAVGFTNLSFFCRSYKQLFGHSPGKEN
jgi:AraC-like DNA-binding protein